MSKELGVPLGVGCRIYTHSFQVTTSPVEVQDEGSWTRESGVKFAGMLCRWRLKPCDQRSSVNRRGLGDGPRLLLGGTHLKDTWGAVRLERSRGNAIVKLRCSKLLRGQDDGDRASSTKAIGFLAHKLLAGKDPQPLAQGCQLADAQLKASAGHGCNGSYLDIRDSCLNSRPQIGLR